MAVFQYVASAQNGQSIRGSMLAVDKADVIKKLREKGLFLVSCRIDDETLDPETPVRKAPPAAKGPAKGPAKAGDSAAPSKISVPGAPAWWSDLVGRRMKTQTKGAPKGKVTLKELVVFTRQISISINAGMSFVDALQGIEQNMKNPFFAYALRSVLDDILSGHKLSDALTNQSEVFKPVYVSMVAAGEAGGFVPDALNRVAEFLEKEIELKAKIKSAMVYPVVIGIVAFAVVTFMMMYIVPIFIDVFEQMNAPLPAPTKMLIVFSSFLRHGGFLSPLVVIGLFVWIKKLRARNEKIRQIWDERILHMPLFGKLVVLSVITRFIRTLATLVDNGVMALQALSIARQVVENRTIEGVVDEIFSSVQQGNGISPVLYKSKYFPVLVANMVSTGEKTGELPAVLMKMADYYDSEVSVAVRNLLTMMEPLLIVVMAVIVGFIIAGLMLPTFQLSTLF